jgi:hypothetical protein
MTLAGNDLYIANADALWRFPYKTGETTLGGKGSKVMDLPAGINHHWTKNVAASPGRQEAVRDRRLEQQRRRERHGGRTGPRRDLGSLTSPAARAASLLPACATRTAWPSSRKPGPCGPPSTSATKWATNWCPTT